MVKRQQVFRKGCCLSLATMFVSIGGTQFAYGQRMTAGSSASKISRVTAPAVVPRQIGIAQELAEPISSPAIIAARLSEVVRHQNEIRRERLLPTLSPEAPSIARHFAHPNLLSAKIGVESVSKAGTTMLGVGNTWIKGAWGDVNSTNFAYLFDGTALKKAQPFAEFVIEHFVPNNEVYLVRNMSASESNHWLKKDIDALKTHPRYWGYEKGVAHFELGGRSWIGSHRPVAAAWKVPKDVLLKWFNDKKLAMGITSVSRADNSVAFNIEVVVDEGAWRELADYRVQNDSKKVSRLKKILSWFVSAIVSRKSKTRAAGTLNSRPPISLVGGRFQELS